MMVGNVFFRVCPFGDPTEGSIYFSKAPNSTVGELLRTPKP